MKSTTPVFEKLELTYVVREMRRIWGWILKNDSYLLIRNRIYPFRLFMKRKVGSVSHPDDETEIPHQNWNQRLNDFLYDDPISEVKFHSFYNPDNDHGHDQESGLLPG